MTLLVPGYGLDWTHPDRYDSHKYLTDETMLFENILLIKIKSQCVHSSECVLKNKNKKQQQQQKPNKTKQKNNQQNSYRSQQLINHAVHQFMQQIYVMRSRGIHWKSTI